MKYEKKNKVLFFPLFTAVFANTIKVNLADVFP